MSSPWLIAAADNDLGWAPAESSYWSVPSWIATPRDVIFADGFESSTTCWWSQTQPPASCPPDFFEITIDLPGGVTMDLVRIQAGSFGMGSPVDERGRYDWEDLHQVTLTQDYYFGKTEVTQAQWEAVAGTPMPSTCLSGVGPDYPVYCVSWHDVVGTDGFVDQLNAHLASTGQPGAGLFRLPTEAEWERAARAGSQDRFSHGNVLSCDDACGACTTHDQYMWWCGNDNGQSEPVGSKQANDFGLYDMHGSLFEWVQDLWESHLGYDPVTDPAGPATGPWIVGRGGDWHNHAGWCRSAIRNSFSRYDTSNPRAGFRLARSQ